MKLSNKFTMCRIIGAPIMLLLYFIPIWTGVFVAGSVFVMVPLLAFLEFTDFLDGYYARKSNQVSDFGKLFDPFADVILHITTFACLMFEGFAKTAFMPPIIFMLIIYREFGINFVRMIASKKGIAIGARKGGKFKTCVYIFSGIFALSIECAARLGFELSAVLPVLKSVALALFVLSLVLSYVSFADYLKNFGSIFKDEVEDTGNQK